MKIKIQKTKPQWWSILSIVLFGFTSCQSFLFYSGLRQFNFKKSIAPPENIQFQDLIGYYSTEKTRGHSAELNIQNNKEVLLVNHNSFGIQTSYGQARISENELILTFDSTYYYDPLKIKLPYWKYEQTEKYFFIGEEELHEQNKNGTFSLHGTLIKTK